MSPRFVRHRAAVLLLSLACAPVLAQQKDEPLVSDRPDLVETSAVVGRGRV